MEATPTPQRIRLGIAAVEKRTGYQRTTIWRKARAGEFPLPHYIGNRRAWFEDQIAEWEAAQMARPRTARRGARNLLGSGSELLR